ncbi:glucosamine-6-phosphate deaminase [Leucobacter sp. CSA2]|uniref:Glucosamine-6-phosphate deaminase n=1 Tax=Leucobacter edaphi TaxID=2796472 RepID=A0A934QBF8_9MICO|nr:glucosamine-6-phosphate deaminase [Leucobacter edaphi]MBK0421589.1 glucosamine-6-phosphate deaminase [Leucobacter edaphi]
MDVRVLADLEALGNAAAEHLVAQVERKPDAVIGLATGSSPVVAYREWGGLARRREISLDRVRGFALDEYIGLDPEDPRSYHAVIRDDAVNVVGLDPERVRVPFARTVAEAAETGAEYERAIAAAGGIDLQILGIGRNGHLAFNEPGSAVDSRTRAVELTPETREDNARFFESADQVPTHAITQGIGTILEARALLMIATGAAKAAAVAAAIEGPETEALPASFLRRHADVIWLLDEAAASRLGQ